MKIPVFSVLNWRKMNVENAHGGEVENALTWQHEKDPDELYD